MTDGCWVYHRYGTNEEWLLCRHSSFITVVIVCRRIIDEHIWNSDDLRVKAKETPTCPDRTIIKDFFFLDVCAVSRACYRENSRSSTEFSVYTTVVLFFLSSFSIIWTLLSLFFSSIENNEHFSMSLNIADANVRLIFTTLVFLSRWLITMNKKKWPSLLEEYALSREKNSRACVHRDCLRQTRGEQRVDSTSGREHSVAPWRVDRRE